MNNDHNITINTILKEKYVYPPQWSIERDGLGERVRIQHMRHVQRQVSHSRGD